jgi:H+/Cl- antiporter ClcA/CBS domain-containing protein
VTVPTGLARAAAAWRLRGSGYVRKWLVLGALIGLVAGSGAVVFFGALELGTHWLLDVLGGYQPPSTVGEGGGDPGTGFARPWAIPLLVAGGALASGLLVSLLAPEAEGHGTDAAIAAIHHQPTSLRARAALVKIVASALTIGSGGSGGREGPTAQISATFASAMARRLNLTPADARIAVSAGMASGIAAIFRAPLGGALLGAELLFLEDMAAEALMPSLVASIVAFSVFGAVHGFTPIFGYLTGSQFSHPGQLLGFAVLGLVAGLVGRGYAVSFYRLGDVLRRLPVPRAVLPGLAGLAVGLLGLVVPGALGTGYGWVQQEMDAGLLLSLPLWLVLALPVAKILATSLSIGSGGSGGIFGPGMVIGAATGAALWRLLEPWFPALPADPAPFVVVGMIACFGSVAHAPLAVMLMVGEMTGNLSLLAPAMIAVALASVAVGDVSIYRSQLRTRADSPAARLRAAMSPATSVQAQQTMSPPRLLLPLSTNVADALARLDAAGLPGAPVVAVDGGFAGAATREALRATAAEHPERTMAHVPLDDGPTLPLDAHLDAAAETLATSGSGWVPVLDDRRHVVGILGTADLIRGYRLSLRSTLRRLHRSGRSTALVELRVEPGSPAAGHPVRDLTLPAGATLMSVHQGSELVFPDGDTVLREGQVVTALVREGDQPLLERLVAAPAAPDAAAVAPG